MICKTITYEDFDGNQRTENFWFHLSKAEIVEMEMGVTGGFSELLKNIIATKDTKQIIEQFKDLLFKAYGEKTTDGRRFIKSDELSKAFSETEAYSQLFMELAFDADAASAFVRGIMPPNLNKQI